MKKVKVLFTDLDGTLINTITKSTFPKGIWDMKLNFNVLDKIKKLNPNCIYILTNQGGIGKFVKEREFKAKFEYIKFCVGTYCNITTFGTYCSSLDKDNIYRKPNIGMFLASMETLNVLYNKTITKKDCLMLGDASGKSNDFSDTDKKSAENFGIDYIDVDDFLKLNI